MLLEQQIKKALENNIEQNNDIENSVQEILNAYNKSVDSGTDFLGNKFTNINYEILKKTFVSAFNISLNTSVPFNLALISPGLVSSWASARLVLPAIPPPGFSIVTGISVLASVASPVPLDGKPKDDLDSFSKSLATFFINHAKTVSFNYIGLSSSVPPIPLVLPFTGVILK